MTMSPVLLLHICAGTVGLLSGAVAISLLKGSRRHSVVGRVFVVAMLCLAATGVFMAVLKFQPGNILGGIFTFYLVATAWAAARYPDGEPLPFLWAALLLVVLVTATQATLGIQAATSSTGTRFGYPPGPYFFLGSVALLATLGDIRLLVRGSINRVQRLSRHLWRMCFGLFIASASVFLARQRLFPAFMRQTGMLYLLSFMPLLLMFFWLLRVRFARVYKNVPTPETSAPRRPASAAFWQKDSTARGA